MHYRWSYRLDRTYAGTLLEDELTEHLPLPRAFKRLLITQRQYRGFVRGDGVTDATRAHVEQAYLNALDRLEAIFTQRPFVLGGAPTIADFGLMAPMFRHFALDPTPAALMRSRAPRVYEWVARMWNLGAHPDTSPLLAEVDAPLAGLLTEACETHLPQLRENAIAYARQLTRYDQDIQGCQYKRIPVSRYRVWCLEELRREWAALDEAARQNLRTLLPEPHAAVLWNEPLAESGYDVERLAPFNRAINVYGKGVPR